ncbi:MAG: B3/B4 domain-containing protein [Promethearchaeota archaeon]
MVQATFSPDLRKSNIGLRVATWEITSFEWIQKEYTLDPVFSPIIRRIREEFTLSDVKNQPIIAAYRQFYWKYLRLDPTKIRPAGEALIRRILHKKPIPKISPFVDAYNWASIATCVAMGAYSLNKVKIPIHFRLTQENEPFQPIGKPSHTLSPKTLVTSDAHNQILCQYPYRDSHFSLIQPTTKKMVLIAYGIPEISQSDLFNALERTKTHLDWLVAHDIIQYSAGSFEYYKN